MKFCQNQILEYTIFSSVGTIGTPTFDLIQFCFLLKDCDCRTGTFSSQVHSPVAAVACNSKTDSGGAVTQRRQLV